uniref:Uncharacterized protein n=1 Tax=Steinernema glaseri TaxID=37863 RepID=A0A1I7XW73_9BILA
MSSNVDLSPTNYCDQAPMWSIPMAVSIYLDKQEFPPSVYGTPKMVSGGKQGCIPRFCSPCRCRLMSTCRVETSVTRRLHMWSIPMAASTYLDKQDVTEVYRT